MTERIALDRCEDPRDAIHRAVACLAQGGRLAFPCSGGYALFASALKPPAVAQLAAWSPAGNPLALTLHAAAELQDWLPTPSLAASRLTHRSWPGPLILAVPGTTANPHPNTPETLFHRLDPAVRQHLAPPDQPLHLVCPHPEALRHIAALVPGPLVMAQPSPPILDPDTLAHPEAADLIFEHPALLKGPPPTLVRLHEGSIIVLREGAISSDQIHQRLGTIILFVCTGNTCRSPMAEALCRMLLARRLDCPPDQLETRGYHVASAGISAYEGSPAAHHAIDVVAHLGASLADHASRRVDPQLIDEADWILVMTHDHRDTLLHYFPEAAPRLRLLHSLDDDIDDPIGGDHKRYQSTAADMLTHLERFLSEIEA